MKKIFIIDSTLRDVENSTQEVTFRDKLLISEKLEQAKVNAIELPLIDNCKEKEIICQTICSSLKDLMVKIPVGEDEESLVCSVNCVKGAKSWCLQVCAPLSTVQMEYFYHLKAPAMLEKIKNQIALASKYSQNVELVAYDVFRADKDFVIECVKTAREAGASSVVLCDDAGKAFPEEYFNMVKEVKSNVDIDVYVKPSNILKMAVSCAFESLRAGAEGVVVSGVDGGLSLVDVANVVREKGYDLVLVCDVDVTKINSISSEINGVIDTVENEEQKKDFGVLVATASLNQIVEAVNQLGYELSAVDNGKVYEEFKKVTSKKEAINLKELEAIVASTAMQVPSTYHLVNYVVNSGNIIMATASVTLEKDGQKFTGVSTGDGPIDAAFHAIEQVVGHHYELDDFQVHAVTKGRSAVGSSLIRLRAKGKLYPGNGVSTDIVGACIRAYVNALNKIVHEGN